MARDFWKKTTKGNITPIIFLIIVFIGFFYKFFFKGLIPIPSDITVGMYYPWINNSYGYPVRVPFKNATLTDTVSQFWIWRNWAIESLKQGTIAVWNPYSLAGYPMSPWFHTVLFQPSNIFYFLFTKTTAMGLIVSAQLLYILISTYFFLKCVTRSTIASIFGSLVFSFSSYNLGWLTWGTVSFSLACLPLILLFLEKNNYLLLSFSILFCILGGHPQTIFYCALISFLYYLIKLNYKFNLKIIISAILGVLMASFILLPSLEIVQNSIRNKDVFIKNQDYSFINYADIFISTISQNYFGNPGTQNYWGKNTMQEKLSGVSILAILLAIIYFIKNKFKTSKLSIFGYTLIVLGIILSTKYPLGWLIYYLKVPLISTSPASRALILVVFGVTIVSVESFLLLVKNKYSQADIYKSSTILLLLLSTLYLPIIYSKYLYSTQETNIKTLLILDKSNFDVAFRNLSLTLFICIFSIILLSIISKSKLIHKKFFLAILLSIPIAEGFYFGWKYTPFTDPKFYFPSTPALNFVIEKQHQSLDFFRVEREKAEILPPNMWQAYGLSSYSGYDPIYPDKYSEFLISNNMIKKTTRYFENDQKTLPYFQNIGIKYFFKIKNNNKEYSKDTWQEVFQEKNVSILENLKYTPPYGLINQQKEDKINLVKHSDNYWEFKVTNSNDTEFYLYENNYNGWVATVNNIKIDINYYQNTFKSVDINKGQNIIIFTYRNNLFMYGLFISVISTLLLIVIQYQPKWQKKLDKSH
ncbi:hypothetical protein COU93_02625 [Candidatus Shapirobacteria bacterium CG10_big_fil_rev_8_21_14_0_10_36_6]|nr:MAG: hypothetical protein COZ41_02675 [Candidatus Shapirobacteria bacterium CG_4_10_14_3_um_filter_35_13]PJE66740.1 MAG: hypothetical protein COU93_02625 [Candidatus Shapirobacteria bacterium CG10_big_fil_rev_8_21_14_0_10_36_6]